MSVPIIVLGKGRARAGAGGGGGGDVRTLLFHADWSTGIGTAVDSIRDTGKAKPFTGTYISAPEVRVTALDGLDFPSTNYLRLTDAACGVYFDAVAGYIAALAVGASLYLRFYIRNTQTGASGDAHGIYFDDSFTVPNWGPQIAGFYIPNIVSDDLTWWLSAHSGANDRRYWGADALPRLVHSTTYRQELRIGRLSTTTYELEARIYDINGNLLDGAWVGTDDENGGDPPDPLSADVFTVAEGAFTSLQGLRVSLEDPQGGTGGYMAVACVAIATDDWCGPYPIAGVED